MFTDISITPDDLEYIFLSVANKKGISAQIIEKDFWVTWLLNQLFSLNLPVKMTFKGGTSLSKGYNLIHRFSEDCDITLCRRALGFVNQRDPLLSKTRKQRDLLLKDLKNVCISYVTQTLKDSLQNRCQDLLTTKSWKLESNNADLQAVKFFYPSVLKGESFYNPYLGSSVLLEFGVRGDVYPCEDLYISSFAEEFFSELSSKDSPPVSTLKPIRTFWEKLTLLHAEHHRPLDKPTPLRISRHYYDCVMLYKSGIAQKALEDFTLLEDVIQNKTTFFQAKWAQYESVFEKGLCILPSSERLKDLEQDYSMTKIMLFDEVPNFESLLADLEDLETLLNPAILTNSSPQRN